MCSGRSGLPIVSKLIEAISFQSSTAPPRKEPRVELAACSRKEFFDEFADNLEARSDRYTHQSGPGIIALF